MNALNTHFVAQMSVERLLNCLAEGTAIALFAWLVLWLIGRRNSGTRFAVWFCALVAIALAPFVEISGPATAMTHPASAAITMPRAWSLYLFGAWAVIAAIGLARVVMGIWHLRAIRTNCERVDLASLDPMVRQTLAEFRSVRPVELCASDLLHVPTAVGFFRPAVVVPRWALQELSPPELNAVLLHELAHLWRWDDWTNLAQRVLRALFFFHPAVWFVESRLSLEREMACDDMVLAQTANPRAYAECLVSLAEKNFLQRGVALAQAAVGRMKQTSLRVLQILDARRPKAVGVWKPAPWVVAGFSVACLVGAGHAPRLVAFGDLAPSRADSSIAGMYPADARADVPPVVPVSFAVRGDRSNAGNRKITSKRVTQHANRNVSRSAEQLALVRAKMSGPSVPQVIPSGSRVKETQPELGRASRASLQRTSTGEFSNIAVVQQAVFVVMQDDPYGNGRPVLWQVRVWRFTVVPRSAPHAISETSKTI
jgi:beta-lactamase regulating signal transducer with metallopeptidase domain